MKKFLYFAVVFATLAYLPGAKADEGKVDLGAPQSGVRMEMMDITAKISAIDYATRHVTLEDPAGGALTLKVDEAVKDLNKVKKGDKVAIQYQKSVSWKLVPKKTEKTKTVTKSTTTEPGSKTPEITKTTQTDIIATVKAVDKAASTVTLQGPEGKDFTVKVRNPAVLDAEKSGDKVSISYTESVAVSVSKVKG